MDYPKTVLNVGLVNGKFIDEDNDTGQAGSLIPAVWGNAVTDELLAVIRAGGLEPDEVDQKQLLEAIRVIARGEIPVHTTLVEYGITDAYTKREVEERLRNQVIGQYKKLACSASGLDALVKVTADQLIVGNDGYPKVLNGVNLSFSGGKLGANGLDSGVLAASSWYSLWVIWNGVATAGLLSLSATEPHLPAGYTHKARVGWVRTDSTLNKYPLGFSQVGKRVQYRAGTDNNVPVLPVMASGSGGTYSLTTPIWAAVSTLSVMPSTASTITLNISRASGGGGAAVAVAPNSSYRGCQTLHPAFFDQANVTNWGNVTISMIVESSNIYWTSTAIGGVIACAGWEDEL